MNTGYIEAVTAASNLEKGADVAVIPQDGHVVTPYQPELKTEPDFLHCEQLCTSDVKVEIRLASTKKQKSKERTKKGWKYCTLYMDMVY